MKNSEIRFLNLKKQKHVLYNSMISSDNQIYRVYAIEEKNLLILILDDGRIKFYNLDNFEFIIDLNIPSTASCCYYSETLKKLIVATQVNEIIIIELDRVIRIIESYQIKNDSKTFKTYHITQIKELQNSKVSTLVLLSTKGELSFLFINQKLQS